MGYIKLRKNPDNNSSEYCSYDETFSRTIIPATIDFSSKQF